jgi:PIN like domain
LTRTTSGKPSASSSAAPEVTLFIDRCAWSGALGRALQEHRIPFVAHHERFAPDAPDDQWLRAAAGQGWVVVTRDQRIRYKVNEQAAAVQAGLHLFVFTQGGLTAAATADILVRAYPALCTRVATQAPPAFWSLQKSGAVSLLKLGRG